jgi:thiosulfate/3-mercaptopyruvate sulfurtransferase
MPSSSDHATLIDVATLAHLLATQPDAARLFDCRFDLSDPEAGKAAYARGHLPGARYLHLDMDLSGTPTGSNGRHPLPERTLFARTLERHGLRNDMQVVAYDAQDGMYAARLWWMLRWLGHRNVAVLDGGWSAWMAAHHPVETSSALDTMTARRSPLSASPADGFALHAPLVNAVSMTEVARTLPQHTHTLIDARAPNRYRGEANALDPRAGHIPGAINRFFKDNLQPDGRFKPAHILREEFAPILGDIPAQQVILYCGSGVTACHNALAMETAGLSGATLYAGSWSEWSADLSQPVEVSKT